MRNKIPGKTKNTYTDVCTKEIYRKHKDKNSRITELEINTLRDPRLKSK